MFHFKNEEIKVQAEKLQIEFTENNLEEIQTILSKNGISFGAIKKRPDDFVEIFHCSDYLLLGPCGGVNGARGKYLEFVAFDHDLDKFDEVLKADVQSIVDKTLDVIWLRK